jgi:hypothetical protein
MASALVLAVVEMTTAAAEAAADQLVEGSMVFGGHGPHLL